MGTVGRKKSNTVEFIVKAKKKHGSKFDYSKVEYIGSGTKVKIICPEHGIFEQRANSHLGGDGCTKCVITKNANRQKSTIDEFIIKAKQKHDNKYDYSLVEYIDSKTKVEIICPVHGVFDQTPNHHLKGRGCPMCGTNAKSNTLEFTVKAKKVHGDKFDYSLVEYIGVHSKVEIICLDHGVFSQTPNSHLKGRGCPICKVSKGEERVTKYLITNNIGYMREHTYPALVSDKGNPLRFDFYIPSLNTCIEYDGEYHYMSICGSDLKKGQIHDKQKDEYCKKNCIHLIRIPYTQFNEIEDILYTLVR